MAEKEFDNDFVATREHFIFRWEAASTDSDNEDPVVSRNTMRDLYERILYNEEQEINGETRLFRVSQVTKMGERVCDEQGKLTEFLIVMTRVDD